MGTVIYPDSGSSVRPDRALTKGKSTLGFLLVSQTGNSSGCGKFPAGVSIAE